MYRTVAALIVLFASVPALAQQQGPCTERTAALTKLSVDYGESPVAIGLTSDGNVLEVLASERGTWTILVTTPQGMTCGVASGEAWSKAPNQKKHDGNVGL